MSSLSETGKTKHSEYVARSYSGIIGLNIDGVEKLTQNDVLIYAGTWMLNRMNEMKPTINAIVGNTETLLYIYNDEGVSEQCVRVYGEIASKQNHMSDSEILQIIYSLFEYLKICLEQKTVRFTYNGYNGSTSYRIESV